MLRRLAQRWFLLLLLGGLSVALALPHVAQLATEHLPLQVVIALALFLMAWTMPSRSLAGELRRPGACLWAITISYGLLPAAAWALGELNSLPDVRIGLLLAASVP